MWTKRKIFMFSISIGLIVFSIFFLSLPIFCIGFLFIIYFLAVPPTGELKPEIARHIDRTLCFIGDEPEVALTVRNPSENIGFFELWDMLPDRVGVGKATNGGFYSIEPGTSRELTYQVITPYRGDYILGPVNINVIDPLGLDMGPSKIFGGFNTLSVLPYVKDVTNLEPRQIVPKVYPGTFLVKQVGTSTQFWSIRDYVKGDPYKAINWKASARRKKLLVNEHEKESICDVIIVLDGRIVNTVGTIRDNPFEYAMKGGAGIASFLLTHGNDVGLVVYSSKIGIVLPRGGSNQMDTINAYLTKVLPTGNLPMNFAMNVAKAYIPPKSTIIIFTTLIYDPTILVTVRDLVTNGSRVIVVALSSSEFETSMFYLPPVKSKMIELEFRIMMDKIKTVGAKVISWYMNEPIDVVIDRVNMQ